MSLIGWCSGLDFLAQKRKNDQSEPRYIGILPVFKQALLWRREEISAG